METLEMPIMDGSYIPSIEKIILRDNSLRFDADFQSSYVQATIQYLREFNQSFQNRKLIN